MSNMEQRQYDVVVVGGGLAGMSAAIAAARHGVRAAVIQARSVLGGNASSEVRMHIVGAGCHNSKKDLNETGLLMELLLENKLRNPYSVFPVWDGILWEKARYQPNLDTYLN
ncbi:MAG: FAD-dependent oxidoreductase, partial [Clostridia bacterium]|nr:FAD-dependent oxidoreductase [Clostridia bacterium]